jgi:hypothetical protein
MSTPTSKPPCLRSSLSRSSSATSTTSTSSTSSQDPRRVHFPPSPSLVSFHAAYPASAYDRTPLVVQANPCALPPRNSRFYALVEPPKRRAQSPYRAPNSQSYFGVDECDEDLVSTDDSDSSTSSAKSSPPATQMPHYVAAKPRTSYGARAPCNSLPSSMSCLDGF